MSDTTASKTSSAGATPTNPFSAVVDPQAALAARLLLGTQRSPDKNPVDPHWQAALAPESADEQERFLRQAAAWHLIHVAGQPIQKYKDALPEPCTDDNRPFCSKSQYQLLERVYSLEPSLAYQWCVGAQARNVKPWPEHVPRLLDTAAQMVRGSPCILVVAEVIGPRAAWLGHKNPRWKRLVSNSPTDGVDINFNDATGDARVKAFEEIRRADPAVGLSKLTADWAAEPVETRIKLLQGLSIGFSIADEPFLEGLLDDKRKTVREKAAELLSTLAGSRLVNRMAERFAAMVQKSDGKLEIQPPQDADPAMLRDGITIKSIQYGVGTRGWILQQIASATPLDEWSSATGLSASECVGFIGKSEWKDPLRYAIVESWKRFPIHGWTHPLLESAIKLGDQQLIHMFMMGLEPAEREKVLGPRLDPKTHKPAHWNVTECLISSIQHDWSPALTSQLLDLASAIIINSTDNKVWNLRNVITSLGHWLDPDAVIQRLAGEHLPEDKREAWNDCFKTISNKIQMRAEIHKEFAL